MLSQEETTFEGEYFTVTNPRNEPKGPQRPHAPIVIGGTGERRTLKTVARWADHWNSAPLGPQDWNHKVSVLEAHCADVGRDPGEIIKSMMVRLGHDDLPRLPQTFQMLADMGVDEAIVSLRSPHHPDQVLEVAKAASSVV